MAAGGLDKRRLENHPQEVGGALNGGQEITAMQIIGWENKKPAMKLLAWLARKLFNPPNEEKLRVVIPGSKPRHTAKLTWGCLNSGVGFLRIPSPLYHRG